MVDKRGQKCLLSDSPYSSEPGLYKPVPVAGLILSKSLNQAVPTLTNDTS